MKKLPVLILIKNSLSESIGLETCDRFKLWKTIQQFGCSEVRLEHFDKVHYSITKNTLVIQEVVNGTNLVRDYFLDDFNRIIVIDKTSKLGLRHDKIEQICYTGREWGRTDPLNIRIGNFFNNDDKYADYYLACFYCNIFKMVRTLCPDSVKDFDIVDAMRLCFKIEKIESELDGGHIFYINTEEAVRFIEFILVFIFKDRMLSNKTIKAFYKEFQTDKKLVRIDLVCRILFLSYYACKIKEKHCQDIYGNRKKAEDYYVTITGKEMREDLEKFKFGEFINLTRLSCNPFELSVSIFPRILRVLAEHDTFYHRDVLRVELEKDDNKLNNCYFSYNMEFRFAPQYWEEMPMETPIKKNTTVHWL